LDKEEVPTSSVARDVIDLNQPPPGFPLSEKAIPNHYQNSESNDGHKDIKCKSCYSYEIQIQSFKDDVSELHKEILKLRRKKRLMTKNYELEVAELNKKIKNNEPKQRFNTSSINNIIINSEGQSSKSKEIWKYQVCIFLLFVS